MAIWEKDRYVAPYEWLINKHLREYDLSKANISLLLEYGFISKKRYDEIFNMPREQREITVGLMQRDNPELSKGLSNCFKDARRRFFEINELNPDNVLYIDKDSITTIDTLVPYTRISDNLEFKLKNEYSSFYRLQYIDFLYYCNGAIENFRLKGAGKQVPTKHKEHFMQFLLALAYTAQTDTVENCILMIKDFYYNYTHRLLDREFYRELNNRSMFKIVNSGYHTYYADAINSIGIEFVDISHNADILRILYRIFMTEYFSKR